MTRIWAYDPGGTTGWALFERTTEPRVPGRLISWGELPLWHDLDSQIRPGDEVVHESLYVLSPGFNPIGIEVVGVIKFLCDKAGITPVGQSPGVLAGPYKWPRTKEIRSAAKSPHAYDAILHGIVYLKFPSLDDVIRQIS